MDRDEGERRRPPSWSSDDEQKNRAEDRGFEPLRAINPTRFPSERHRPLGESSAGEITRRWRAFRAAPYPGHRPPVRCHLAQPPQGRKAARVGGLCQVRGGSLCVAVWYPNISLYRLQRALGSAHVVGSLPHLPAGEAGRRGGPRTHHHAPGAGFGQRSRSPRVPLLRPPRLRQDIDGADHGPIPQLRAGTDIRAVWRLPKLCGFGRGWAGLHRRHRTRRCESRRRG